MKKPRNPKLRDSLRDFCTSAIPILLLKHKSEHPLLHISGSKAEIDEDGFVIALDEYPKDTNDKELIFFIMMHGNLPDYARFISECWDNLEIISEYKSCENQMENDPKVSRHLNRLVMALDRGSSHDVKYFVRRFLDVFFSNLDGIRYDEKIFIDVYTDFEDFLYSDVVKYTTFVAIWGFHKWSDSDLPEPRSGIVIGPAVLAKKMRANLKPIQLTKRSRIVPQGLSSIHKYINVQGGFLITTLTAWNFPYILEFSGSVPKFFKDDNKWSRHSSSQYLHDELAKLIGALRLFKKGDIQYSILGSVTYGWLEQLGRGSLNTPSQPLVHNTYDITDDEVRDLAKFCNYFTSIKYNEFLEMAMSRFNISYERSQFKDALIDQMIAFEALLIQKEYKGIGVTLSRRVANLLGENLDEKQHLFDVMYDAYYIRSKIVHGDQNNEVASMLESKQKPMIWYVYDIQEILRKTIRKYAQLVKDGLSKTDIIEIHDSKIESRSKRRRP